MKNLKSYEDWLITEANKTVQFFKEHPEFLSKYRTGDEKLPAKQEPWNPRYNQLIDTDADHDINRKIREQAAGKFKKAGFDFILDWPENEKKRDINFAEWITATEHNYSNHSSEEFIKKSAESKTFDQFISEIKYTSKPNYYRGEWTDFNFASIVKENWKKFHEICKWTQTAIDNSKNASQKHFDNELMKLGLSKNDVYTAMTFIKEWTSMSRKKLDPSAWPLLKRISVDPSLLPKYAYRGIFFDGAKIKDQKKFIEQWAVGNKPGFSQGKATSWTIDRGTAASFMVDQDYIKDKKNGYFILLKMEVDPQYVIADLRNLPVDHMFWNQQELIIDQSAKNFEVDTIIPGAEEETYREFNRSFKGGQGASGTTKKDFVTRMFLNMPYDTIPVLDRIMWKELCYMTLSEANDKYGGNLYTGAIKEDPSFGSLSVHIPIWLRRYSLTGFADFKVINRNEIDVQVYYTLDTLSWGSKNQEISNEIKAISKSDSNFNQYAGNLLISGWMKIKLIDPSYFNVQFEISLPKEMKIEKSKRDDKRDNQPRDILANKIITDIYNKYGSETFVDMITKEAQNINPPRNIHYTIK